jgi:hypothetical protein
VVEASVVRTGEGDDELTGLLDGTHHANSILLQHRRTNEHRLVTKEL